MSVFDSTDFRRAVQQAEAMFVETALRNFILCKELSLASIPGLHDALLFACAYPPSEQGAKLAQEALVHLELLLAKALKKAGKKAALKLEGSGLSGSVVRSAFGWDLTRWLCKNYPNQLKLDAVDWEALHGMDILKLLLPRVEQDRLLTEQQTIQYWIEQLAGDSHPLEFLLDLLEKRIPDSALREYIYQLLDVRIVFQLDAETGSRTNFLSIPQKVFVHEKSLQKQVNLMEELTKKEMKRIALSPDEQAFLYRSCRMQLMSLGRETDPVAYADTAHLRMYDCGRGFRVLLLPMRPDKRLPIESFIGYMGFKNRRPIAYGGAWIYGNRCRIGLNVFEAYRGGESIWLFSALMRCYKQVFGLDHFLVDPYQLGKDNEEGIQSGAFWFYYRLGFRPQQQDLLALAELENQRMLKDKTYKTKAAILRKLANAQMALSCSNSAWDEEPVDIAVQLSKAFSLQRGKEDSAAGAELKRRLGYARNKPLSEWLVGLAPWLNERIKLKLSEKEKAKLRMLLQAKMQGDEFEWAAGFPLGRKNSNRSGL